MITLGLLHCDLDTPASQYAPVSSQALAQAGYDGWYLGHIHIPGAIPENQAPFYLGSVTALNPKEQGVHGPVLVRVSSHGQIHQERVPLAPLRWENLEVDCQGLVDAKVHLRGLLLKSIKAFTDSLIRENEQTLALGLRLVLVGQVDAPAEFQSVAQSLDPGELTLSSTVFVDQITSRVTGTFDLVALSRENHPAGILARQILLLENPAQKIFGIEDAPKTLTNLLSRARRVVEDLDSRDVFSQLTTDLEENSISDQDLIQELISSARSSLADLLANHGGGHAFD